LLPDQEAAIDAVLSLKSSSLMVGASRLGALAGALEWELRAAGPWLCPAPAASAVRTILKSIGACIGDTATVLSRGAAASTMDDDLSRIPGRRSAVPGTPELHHQGIGDRRAGPWRPV